MNYYDFYPRRGSSGVPVQGLETGLPAAGIRPCPPVPVPPQPVPTVIVGPMGPRGFAGPAGSVGPVGPAGPMGPAGPTGRSSSLGGLQVQLSGGTSVDAGAPVTFNSVVTNSAPDISYSDGSFTLTVPGTYLINWAVNVNEALATDVAFSVNLDSTPIARGEATLTQGQVTGTALVIVSAAPAVLQLVNVTGQAVPLSQTTAVDANLVITRLN